jgi:hypothetical protein
MSTPKLQLETLFVLDAAGHIVSTREPLPTPGPLFALVRGAVGCAWAVRADVANEIADELDRLARQEPPLPLADLRDIPLHAERYMALTGGHVRSGPAFVFPPTLSPPSGVIPVEDERILGRHFRGWVAGEIRAGRAPVMAIAERGYPVSVCFSARSSPVAAEAGVETAEGFRGAGLGARVTAAWALAIHASGRLPLYSTAWSNTASLALARKLHLEAYAADWSVWD